MRPQRPPRDPDFKWYPAVFMLKLQRTWDQMRVRNIQHVSSIIDHISFSDEFAEVKAVKLLRRGRRLQQVE